MSDHLLHKNQLSLLLYIKLVSSEPLNAGLEFRMAPGTWAPGVISLGLPPYRNRKVHHGFLELGLLEMQQPTCHHASARPSAKSTPFGCCSRRECGRPPIACQQISNAVDLEGYLLCLGS